MDISNIGYFVNTAVENVKSVENEAIGSIKKNWPTFKFEALTKLSSIKDSMVENLGKLTRSVVKRFNPDAGARMSMEYHAKKLEKNFSSVGWESREKVGKALSTLSNNTSLSARQKTDILKMLEKNFEKELIKGLLSQSGKSKLEETAGQLIKEIEFFSPSEKVKELVNATDGLKPIGEGNFGAIYKVKGNDCKTYVVKIAKLVKNAGEKDDDFDLEKKAYDHLFTELNALPEPDRTEKLKYFVGYHGACEIDGKRVLITEFVEYENGKGLDFEDYIKNFHSQEGSTNPKEMMRLMEQGFIKTAVEEESNLMNRDTKPKNFMVGKDSDGNLQLKGIDYGTACAYADDKEWETKGLGTPIYMAPEVLKKENYSFSREVYSMGISLLEGLLGEAFPKAAFRFPWKIAEFVVSKGIDGAFGKPPSFENWLKALYPKSDKSKDEMTDDEKEKAETKEKAKKRSRK